MLQANRRAAVLLGAVLLWSCGDDPLPADFVAPSYSNLDPCRYADCGPHGTCAAGPEGGPACMCEVGFRGARCDVCEAGFHRDFNDRCLTDVLCADQTSNPCGPYGECIDAEGVITCACEEGYEGPRCTLCSDRYGRDELGRCLPLTLGMENPPPPLAPPQDGGQECGRGYTGPDCSACAKGFHFRGPACVPDEVCEANSCPPNSECDVISGEISCECKFGYLAPTCVVCTPGNYVNESGVCAPGETCEPSSCPEHAHCSVESGQALCECHPGHTGADCDVCASGYHEDSASGDCKVDAMCSADSCPAHATCSIVAGEVNCTCVTGYVGPDCNTCALGYHVNGAQCVPDETCTDLTCSAGRSTCVVVGGETRCDCEAGWGGDRCEKCIDLGTDYTGFEFPEDWPSTPNTCTTRLEFLAPRLLLRSREAGLVYACGRSTYNGFTSQHVELEAGPKKANGDPDPALLIFWQPVLMASFDYSTRLAPLSFDVYANDELVKTIELAPGATGSLTLQFERPVTMVGLRSRTAFVQKIAIDNVVFLYERCR